MAYIPLPLPPIVDPEVKRVVRKLLDPQLADVHAMLRLPKRWPGLEAGCNLSAGLVLLSVVSGVSVALYRPSALGRRGDRGKLFVEVLEHCYPWTAEPSNSALPPRQGAERLYEAFRNPLVHSLGVYDGPYIGSVKIAKGPLTELEIQSIERATSRPSDWTKPALWTDGNKTVLTVICFYWGVRKMISKVVEARTGIRPRFDDVPDQPTAEKMISATATTSPIIGPMHVGSESTSTGDKKKEGT